MTKPAPGGVEAPNTVSLTHLLIQVVELLA
jgi:hypothetical protein